MGGSQYIMLDKAQSHKDTCESLFKEHLETSISSASIFSTNVILQIWQPHGRSREWTALLRWVLWTRWRVTWSSIGTRTSAMSLIRFKSSVMLLVLLFAKSPFLFSGLLVVSPGIDNKQWCPIENEDWARVCEGRDQVWQGGGLQEDDGQVCHLVQTRTQLLFTCWSVLRYLSLFTSLTHVGPQLQPENFFFPSKMKLKLHDLIYLACLYGQTGIVEDIIQHQQRRADFDVRKNNQDNVLEYLSYLSYFNRPIECISYCRRTRTQNTVSSQ